MARDGSLWMRKRDGSRVQLQPAVNEVRRGTPWERRPARWVVSEDGSSAEVTEADEIP